MLTLLILILVLAASHAVGSVAARFLGYRESEMGMGSAFATGMGLSMMACVILVLCSLHVLYGWLVWSLTICLVLLGLNEHRVYMRRLLSWRVSDYRKSLSKPWYVWAILLLIVFCALQSIAASHAPSVFGEDVAFRLDLAKRFALAHGLVDIPYIPQRSMPLTMEMLYTMALILSGASLANMLHLAMGCLTTMAIYSFTAARWGKLAGLLSSAMFACAPVVGWLSAIAYTDLASTLYQVMMVLGLIEWLETRRRAAMLGTGIAAGMALGVGHSSLVTLSFVIATLLIIALHEEWSRTRSRSVEPMGWLHNPLVAVSALAAITAAPWYVSGWVSSGSPVYPYLASMTKYPQIALAYQQSGLGRPDQTAGLRALVRFPWDLTMYGIRFGGLIGPALLAIIPSAMWIEKWSRPAKFLLIYACFGLFWGFALGWEVRQCLSAVAAASMVAGWAASVIIERSEVRHAGHAYAGLLVITLLVTKLDAGIGWYERSQSNWDRVLVGLGRMDSDSYMSQQLGGTWDTIGYANKKLRHGTKILSVNEKRGFYSSHEFVWGDTLRPFRRGEHPTKCYARLRKMGISHILYVHADHDEQTAIIEEDKTAGYLEPVQANRGVELLHIRYDVRKTERKPTGQDLRENARGHGASPSGVPM